MRFVAAHVWLAHAHTPAASLRRNSRPLGNESVFIRHTALLASPSPSISWFSIELGVVASARYRKRYPLQRLKYV